MHCSGSDERKDRVQGRLGSKGAVSQMLCIVIAALVFMNFAMHDFICVSLQKNISQRTNDFACSSIMADFDETLEKYYGLYCLDITNEEAFLNRYFDIVNESRNNLIAGLLQNDSLDSFYVPERKVGEYGISFLKTLDDEGELKREISDLMKKRSLGNAAAFIADKIATILDLKRDADALAYLNDFDIAFEKIVEAQKELETFLSGIEGIPASGVNGFFESPFSGDIAFYVFQVTDLFPGESMIANEENIASVKNALMILLGGAELYRGFNCDALDAAQCIIELEAGAEEILCKAENALEELKKPDEAADIRSQIRERRNKLNSCGDYRKICLKLQENIDELTAALNAYGRFTASLNKNDHIYVDEVKNVVNAAEKAYKAYREVRQGKIYETGENENPLEELWNRALEATEVYFKFMPAGNTEIDENVFNKLPSKKAGIRETGRSVLNGDAMGTESLDRYYEIFGKQENIPGFLDLYFIDDYIMSFFSSSTEKERPEYYCYLNGEIEYIIFGNRTDDDNLVCAYVSLFGLRTALNIVHILRSDDKMEKIKNISDHPAVIALIVSLWGMSESAFDITNLRNGDKVPLIKTEDDWNCDIDGVADAASSVLGDDEKDENVTALSFKEYLRLLLALVPYETKLLRIKDVLELNCWKISGVYRELSEFATAVKLETEFSVGTLLYGKQKGRGGGPFRVVSYGEY